jgi:trehalose-6-phosphate synthase
MGEGERRRRLDAIRAQVGEHDITAWIDAQLADLDAVEHGSGTRLPV